MDLVYKLQHLYKNSMSAILVRVLGHLPILGNPQAFMSGIVSGM